ncbi:MAG: B12-binding domain-containing radical SAM protein [Nostoc sp.]
MKLLLIYPNRHQEIIGWGDLGAIAEPLALEYVAAGARLDGHQVKILDLRLHPRKLGSTLLEFQPDVLGITGYSMHVLRNLAIAKRAKEILPQCTIVVGGHHATLMPEDFFEPQIDCVIVGEGIRAFRKVLQLLESGDIIKGIPGVWSWVDGQFESGGQPLPLNLEDIPMPDRTLVPEDRPYYYIDWMNPIALLRTTVGCPYRCSFCSLWKVMDGQYYKRDINRVIEEIETIPERYIFLVDDEPFVNRNRMFQLAQAIKEAKVEREFFAYCRIDSFLRNPELILTWREIGLRRLFFGVETIFNHELKDYKKRLELEQIITAIKTSREMDIKLMTNFIIKPEYTHYEFEQLVRFIEDNDVEYPSFTILTPLPGTEYCQTFNHILDLQPNGRPNWDLFDLQNPVTKTKLPKEEFMAEYRNLQRVFIKNYTKTLPSITKKLYNKIVSPQPKDSQI